MPRRGDKFERPTDLRGKGYNLVWSAYGTIACLPPPQICLVGFADVAVDARVRLRTA